MTRPRRHSVSMEPPSPASPAEDDDLNEDTFERISGILSSLIVEAQEAVEENPHAPHRPRPVSRASLVRPKSRLSLRWNSSDSEQSDDEESNTKAKQDDSDSEHDAAVAAVTAGLFEDSDPEDDFLDDDDENEFTFPVDTENVAVQAQDMCESPINESQASEQARCRLSGDRSRPSSWGSSGSTSTLVDHPAPAPSPSASVSRRSLHTKHMSFDLKPTTEFLESMKRIDDSLAEVDFLSKDLVEDLVEDDFEALLNAPPTIPPPLRRNPNSFKRQYRTVGTDTSDLAFAAQPGQHPSEPFDALSAPTAPTAAAKASYLDPFTPAMRARIITSILFPLLHIPHAFVSDSLNGRGAAFHFAAVGDAAVAAGAFQFANVLTWTFLFTVGSLMMDSVTGRSIAQIVDVWHRKDVHGHSHAQDDDGEDLVRTMICNGFVKQTPRKRVICAAGSTEAKDSVKLFESESAWAPEGKEWRVPGAYYPPRSEYERLANVMELLPEEQRMFDDTEETVRGIPGAYYCYSGITRKPDEKEERRRTDRSRHSLPVTLRHEQGAPLHRALLESLFEKGVGKPAEEGWKRVVVVHDLDGDKTDVVVTEDDGCGGAEDQVLEIVAVKRRKVAAPGRVGSLVVMGRRNSI
ncbi:hypothetical protein BC937DRAFT_95305 [Endogone sp. FLAS-F59071]|nr:hypothetical protein BC937DRAFT_95305 [Endogone sp. FLAS-F59071]|eukprot:RUS13451.1 hypothetical protein BC937DRAFT_95305 [Endogone sp. FLAS-F59071]